MVKKKVTPKTTTNAADGADGDSTPNPLTTELERIKQLVTDGLIDDDDARAMRQAALGIPPATATGTTGKNPGTSTTTTSATHITTEEGEARHSWTTAWRHRLMGRDGLTRTQELHEFLASMLSSVTHLAAVEKVRWEAVYSLHRDTIRWLAVPANTQLPAGTPPPLVAYFREVLAELAALCYHNAEFTERAEAAKSIGGIVQAFSCTEEYLRGTKVETLKASRGTSIVSRFLQRGPDAAPPVTTTTTIPDNVTAQLRPQEDYAPRQPHPIQPTPVQPQPQPQPCRWCLANGRGTFTRHTEAECYNKKHWLANRANKVEREEERTDDRPLNKKRKTKP